MLQSVPAVTALYLVINSDGSRLHFGDGRGDSERIVVIQWGPEIAVYAQNGQDDSLIHQSLQGQAECLKEFVRRLVEPTEVIRIIDDACRVSLSPKE